MFKVGQKVWCVACGEGTVTDARAKGSFTYPVSVRFTNGDTESYTVDGKLYARGNRALFFSKPEVDALETPPFEPTLVSGKEYVLHCHFKGDMKPTVFVANVHLEVEDGVWVDEDIFINKEEIFFAREVLDVITFKKKD